MVKIRLRRTGKTKQPSYRIVVADSRSPRDGRFIEIIGHYNPIRQPKELLVKEDRARYWLSVGAQPSDTVANLFKKVQIFDNEGNVLPESAENANGETTETVMIEPEQAKNIVADEVGEETTETQEDTPESAALVEEETV